MLLSGNPLFRQQWEPLADHRCAWSGTPRSFCPLMLLLPLSEGALKSPWTDPHGWGAPKGDGDTAVLPVEQNQRLVL